MAPAPEPKSLLRTLLGGVSLVSALIVIPIGFVLLVGHSQGGSSPRDLVRPLAVLMAGGGLLSFGVAMLIWEMSARYGIRR